VLNAALSCDECSGLSCPSHYGKVKKPSFPMNSDGEAMGKDGERAPVKPKLHMGFVSSYVQGKALRNSVNAPAQIHQ
jgi:hypothetical protein